MSSNQGEGTEDTMGMVLVFPFYLLDSLMPAGWDDSQGLIGLQNSPIQALLGVPTWFPDSWGALDKISASNLELRESSWRKIVGRHKVSTGQSLPVH